MELGARRVSAGLELPRLGVVAIVDQDGIKHNERNLNNRKDYWELHCSRKSFWHKRYVKYYLNETVIFWESLQVAVVMCFSTSTIYQGQPKSLGFNIRNKLITTDTSNHFNS